MGLDLNYCLLSPGILGFLTSSVSTSGPLDKGEGRGGRSLARFQEPEAERVRRKRNGNTLAQYKTHAFLPRPFPSLQQGIAGDAPPIPAQQSDALPSPSFSTFHRPPPAQTTAPSGAGVGRFRRIGDASEGDLHVHWSQSTQAPPPQA